MITEEKTQIFQELTALHRSGVELSPGSAKFVQDYGLELLINILNEPEIREVMIRLKNR